MIRTIAFVLLLLIQGTNLVSSERLRKEYKSAVADEGRATALLEKLRATPSKDALTYGYIAATEALLAKFAFLPTTKYSLCKRSMEDFRLAVAADPENLEIRYLRLAVQVSLPSFLDMSNDIDADRKKALFLLPVSLDRMLQKDVARLLIDQRLCTPAESVRLRTYLD